MQNETFCQIINKIIEIILQTRLDVKKNICLHFSEYFQQIEKKQQPPFTNILQFLQQLLQKDLYSLKSKILGKIGGDRLNSEFKFSIVFTLIQRSTGMRFQSQIWWIRVARKSQLDKSSTKLLVQFFNQLILILNKLPLLSIYHKNKQIKSKYMLDYKLLFDYHPTFTLIDAKAKDLLWRQNQQITIITSVAYTPSIYFFNQQVSSSQVSKRKESMATSDYDGDRKFSVYAFYDPVLDFTFLSSDEQSFSQPGIKENVQIKKFQFTHEEQSQQFQLLIANEEQDFLNDNKELFDLLAHAEKNFYK